MRKWGSNTEHLGVYSSTIHRLVGSNSYISERAVDFYEMSPQMPAVYAASFWVVWSYHYY